MPYNSLTTRIDAGALIPEEVSREIFAEASQQSVVMQLGRRLPNVARNQLRLPVMSALVSAYFVDGDTGLKQTAEAEWENKYINVGELAAIVPVPENILNDADYDIWAELQPGISEAFGRTFDAAVFYGTGAPGNWPDDIVTAATAASHTVTLGTGADVYDDLLGTSGTLSLIEADGYMPTGHVAALSMKARLRGLRDSAGNPIFMQMPQEATMYSLDGAPTVFPTNGSIDATSSLMITGDWTKLVWAMRADMTSRVFTEGVISDAAGNIVYNLMQQDMVALRVVMRIGWQVPNPVNAVQGTEASRYPFSVLIPA